ncbi:uncharacterized protein LOC120336165 [Styela clava]
MNEHTCEICSKKFTVRGRLLRHQQSVHNKLRHKCRECGKLFTRSDALKRHCIKFHRCPKRWSFPQSFEDKITNLTASSENASIAIETKVDERISPPALITIDSQINNFPGRVKRETIDKPLEQTITATWASKLHDISSESNKKKHSESQIPEKHFPPESVTETLESGSRKITQVIYRVPPYTLAILKVLEIYGSTDEFKSTIPHLKKYFVRDNWTSINFSDIKKEDDSTKRTLLRDIKHFLMHLIKNKYDNLEKIVPQYFGSKSF